MLLSERSRDKFHLPFFPLEVHVHWQALFMSWPQISPFENFAWYKTQIYYRHNIILPKWLTQNFLCKCDNKSKSSLSSCLFSVKQALVTLPLVLLFPSTPPWSRLRPEGWLWPCAAVSACLLPANRSGLLQLNFGKFLIGTLKGAGLCAAGLAAKAGKD